MMRPRPEAAVAAFLRACRVEELFLPSLAVAELRYGLTRLPPGRRRATLESDLEAVLAEGFQGRILVFDAACAIAYATARSIRERAGRPLQLLDALIGGMALAHGATLATRNTADFDGYGLTIVDPWKGPAG
jgi:predicted nucleic acid-binding protein